MHVLTLAIMEHAWHHQSTTCTPPRRKIKVVTIRMEKPKKTEMHCNYKLATLQPGLGIVAAFAGFNISKSIDSCNLALVNCLAFYFLP
jgi:hypothetical protein